MAAADSELAKILENQSRVSLQEHERVSAVSLLILMLLWSATLPKVLRQRNAKTMTIHRSLESLSGLSDGDRRPRASKANTAVKRGRANRAAFRDESSYRLESMLGERGSSSENVSEVDGLRG